MSINTEATDYRRSNIQDKANRRKVAAFKRICAQAEQTEDPQLALMANWVLIKLAESRQEPDYA